MILLNTNTKHLKNKHFTSTLLQTFSEFKRKFQYYQSKYYPELSSFYNDLCNFQSKLTHIQQLKYDKALPNLNNKIKKIYQSSLNNNNQQDIELQNLNLKNFHPIVSKLPFSPNLTFQYIYSFQNNLLNPTLDAFNNITYLNLNQILNLLSTVQLNPSQSSQPSQPSQSSQSSLLHLNKYHMQLANNHHPKLSKAIEKRFQIFQEHFCLNIFHDYADLFLEKIEDDKISGSKNVLNKIMVKQANTKYQKGFKLKIKEEINPSQIVIAIQIIRYFTLYNIYSEKSVIFVQQCILDDKISKKLSSKSMKNIIFILSHQNAPLPKLNHKLFQISQILLSQNNINNKFINIVSLLFYIFTNNVENYSVVDHCITDLKIILLNEDNLYIIQKLSIPEKQILLLLLEIAKIKQFIGLKEYTKILTIISPYLKQLQNITMNSSYQYEKFLNKHKYSFQKNIFKFNPFLPTFPYIDTTYKIHDKNFICLNLSKLNGNSSKSKINGVGRLIFEISKLNQQHLKLINNKMIIEMQKWGDKQEYYKSKMKGIPKPKNTQYYDYI